MITIQKVNNTFQAKVWLLNSWNLFKKKPLTWVFMLLMFIIFVGVANTFFIGQFVIALLMLVLAGGIFIALDKASRSEPFGLENLFSVIKDKPILKELLIIGAIGVGVAALTFILQMLTGKDYSIKVDPSKVEGAGDLYKEISSDSFFTSVVSWLWSWALLFGIPLVAINRESAIPALKSSIWGMFLNIVPFIIFFGISILLTILAIIPVGLGLFVLFPVLFGAIYFAFSDIYALSESKDVSLSKTNVKASIASDAEIEEKYVPGIADELVQASKDNTEQKDKSVVYTNNKAHQEEDLKGAYHSIKIFRMIGLVVVAIGVIIAAYTYYSLQIGTNTTGEVVSVETHTTNTGSTRSTSYTPSFAFVDQSGVKHISPTSYGAFDLDYPIGARVKISYNADDYSTVQINSLKSVFYIPMFLWLLGGIILWYAKFAKKDVDENGVPPRKSVFLTEGVATSDLTTVLDKEEIHVGSNKSGKTDDLKAFEVPKNFTLDFYVEYMHITVGWFGKQTITATIAAAGSIIGFILILFSYGSKGSDSPLIDSLLPWIVAIVCLGFLYYALATWLNKTHIFVSQNAIEIRHKPLPWFGQRRIAAKAVKQLYTKEDRSHSDSNNRTTIRYSLHVVNHEENDLTLLTLDTSEQALFLEQEIEKYLGVKNQRVRGEFS